MRTSDVEWYVDKDGYDANAAADEDEEPLQANDRSMQNVED
jgi:hypothetical protein